ncbi:MAG: type II toxin-antitoxin system RelE/ParE family toxin [Deltaproteobacteria bacterium]|nr:type II toxin-antitoxin system RelE/ParE family toxin [Deltaproteobacteria bacterium]
MRWKIEVKPTAEKYYLRLGKQNRKRIKGALTALRNAEDPFSMKNVRPLTGKLQGDYRVRVGKWRILFSPEREKKTIHGYAILPRGDAY